MIGLFKSNNSNYWFVILPPVTVAEWKWIKRSRVPTQTRAGIPCSHERTISSQLLPASLSFVLSPSLPHSVPLFSWLFYSPLRLCRVPAERCVAPVCAARLPVPHSLCRTLAFPWRISQPHGLHWLVESGRGVAIATALILNFSLLDVTWHWSAAPGQPRIQLTGFGWGFFFV